jgi:hypothetical protein
VKKRKRQTLGEKREKDKHLVTKETNQTIGEKRGKDKHVAKKETKTNTW